MQIEITGEIENLVVNLAKEQNSSSYNEVINKAVLLLNQQSQNWQNYVKDLNKKIDEGLEDLAAGRFVTEEEMEEEMEKIFAKYEQQ